MDSTSDEVFVIENALKVMTRALDELAGACTGTNGEPVAPARKALMKARGYLPPSSNHAFQAKAQEGK